MRRRELMLLLGGAMTAARALRAQQKAMPVGRLSPRCLTRPVSPYMDAFRRAKRNRLRRGTKPGDWAEGHSDRLPALAPMTRVQDHPAENAGL